MTMTDSQHLDEELLSSLIDNRLDPAERTAAEQHLASCSQCHQALVGLQATVALLRQLPEQTPPRSFLLAESARPSRLLRLVPLTRAVGALAAALFVVFVSLDFVGVRSTPTQPAAAPAPTLLARPAPQAAESRPVDSAAPATARQSKAAAESEAAPRAGASEAPAGAAAPAAAPQPAAPALRAPAPAGTPLPPGTAPRAGAPAPPPPAAPAQTSGPAETAADQPALKSEPPASTVASSPFRPWQIASGLLALLLLLGSLLLSRLGRRGGLV